MADVSPVSQGAPRPGARLPEVSRSQRLRLALGRFATGVCVVTLRDDDGREHGFTVNSFTSASLDPPLLLISVARSAKAHALLFHRPFAVNVLTAGQEDVAMHFAGSPCLDEVDWLADQEVPRLGAPLAWFSCTPWADYDAGDHTLFLGEIISFGAERGHGLGYFGGRFAVLDEESLGIEYVL